MKSSLFILQKQEVKAVQVQQHSGVYREATSSLGLLFLSSLSDFLLHFRVRTMEILGLYITGTGRQEGVVHFSLSCTYRRMQREVERGHTHTHTHTAMSLFTHTEHFT